MEGLIERILFDHLCKNDPDTLYEMICNLENHLALALDRIDKMEKRITDLERQLAKNSRNSSKPPSSDGLKKGKKKTKSLRKKGGKKSGGQKGHEGQTLRQVEKPDFIVDCATPDVCGCGCHLLNVPTDGFSKRQVFDIPPVTMNVTEYRSESKQCPSCGKKVSGQFPSSVNAPVQYGERVKSLVVYLMRYQFVPMQRTADLFEDLFGRRLSEGTINTILNTFGDKVSGWYHDLRKSLRIFSLLHFDETGMRIDGKRRWIHSAGNKDVTLYHVSDRRGRIAMDEMNILPHFNGTAVHDGYKSYFTYERCDHSLCNAHHLRELTFIHEVEKEGWAEKMMKLLRSIHKKVEKTKANGKTSLPYEEKDKYRKRYRKITANGFTLHSKCIDDTPPKRGKKKQPPGKNLLDRLEFFEDEVLRFMDDFSVPFDNNLAERDIRMVKLQEKISGCLRTVSGSKVFVETRSYISSMKKQHTPILGALIEMIQSSQQIPLPE